MDQLLGLIDIYYEATLSVVDLKHLTTIKNRIELDYSHTRNEV